MPTTRILNPDLEDGLAVHRSLLSVALTTGLGLVLTYLVLTRSLPALLAEWSVPYALLLDSSQPTALLARAEQHMLSRAKARAAAAGQAPAGEPTTEGGKLPPVERIRADVDLALRGSPLSASALRILAQLADEASDVQRASALMRNAAGRSLREAHAQFWLMANALERKDYQATSAWADTLMHARPDLIVHVAPFVAQALQSGDVAVVQDIKVKLARKWSSRPTFLLTLARSVNDQRTVIELFLALKDTANPPTHHELGEYLDYLVERGQINSAYYAWLQFLSTEELARAGYLFNGDFELRPSGLPFDWRFPHGIAATTEIARLPENSSQHALRVEFGSGRVELGGARQTIMLPPGTWRLEGQQRGELRGIRGLVWRVECSAGPGRLLAQSAMLNGEQPSWQPFKVTFVVPELGCVGQSVYLAHDARSASERYISGTAWFDALQIAPVP